MQVDVLSHVYEYNKVKAQLKIKAFNLYHKCQIKCYKENQNESCLDECVKNLDGYFQLKKENNIKQKILFGVQNIEQELSQEQLLAFQQVVQQNQRNLNIKLNKLSDYLNNWEQQYI